MKLTGKHCAVLVTLVTSWVSSGAFAADAAAPGLDGAAPRAQWQLLEPTSEGSVELVARDRAGALATVCQDGECGVFVEPVDGCVPGSQYPLLINSAKQVGVISSTCGVLSANGSDRYVVKLEPQNALFPAMMNGDDISIAFPTQAGAMNVIYISMSGVREHLSRLLPRTDEAAPADQARVEPPTRPSRPEQAPEARPEASSPPTAEAGAESRIEPREDSRAQREEPVQPPRFLVPDADRFGAHMTAT
ncbi:MAG: hypothetical protein R3E87_13865 [Burkholderiaceae bacterium]